MSPHTIARGSIMRAPTWTVPHACLVALAGVRQRAEEEGGWRGAVCEDLVSAARSAWVATSAKAHSSLGPTLPPPPLALRLHSHPQKAWESAASASAGHLLLLLLLLLRSSLDLGRDVAWSSPACAHGGVRSAHVVRAPRHPGLQLDGWW